MMQCADPHISSQQTAPAGVVYAYSLHKANIFPCTLPPAVGIEINTDIVKLSSRKRSLRKTILTVIYGGFFGWLVCFLYGFFVGVYFLIIYYFLCEYKIKV